MTTTPEIEAAARALLEVREKRLAHSIGSTPATWEQVPHWHNELYDDARAALSTLPSEGMVTAATDALVQAISERMMRESGQLCPVILFDEMRAALTAALAHAQGDKP
jgi:hypothetical protein